MPRARTSGLILALGILAVTSCGHGTDATGPSAVPQKPTGPTIPTTPTPIASALAFTVQPAAAFAGLPITPAVQVTVRDSLGATVTTTSGHRDHRACSRIRGDTSRDSNCCREWPPRSATSGPPGRGPTGWSQPSPDCARGYQRSAFGVDSLRASDRIAFVQSSQSRHANVPSSVVVMNVDGSGLGTIYAGGVLGHPRWSPDGRKLVFSGQAAALPPLAPCWWYDVTCQLKIFVANADGSGG